jgi:GDP-L-fucose synthase
MLDPNTSIYVAGHRGMVGSAVVRCLQQQGFSRLLLRSRTELDLTNQSDVHSFFDEHRPQAVVFAAARVGGILANSTYPADFLYENLIMASNAVNAAWRAGTKRFLFLGSTCIYPRLAPQPIPEESLLTLPLEPTNEAYAIAKIAGLKLCEFYRRQHGVLFHSAMPTNLYGPGDNYHPDNSHVLPAMIRRFHEAAVAGTQEVRIWGTGTPLREFLHVNDLAAAILHLLRLPDPPDLVNVGSGQEISILELARLVARVVGYTGRITTDPSKPDGTPRKLCDIRRIQSTGWQPRITLEDGVRDAWQDFLRASNDSSLRNI